MGHKLREITIAGYKSIRDQTVKLRDLNILIGPNGAGKSNFVGAFRFLREVVAGNLAVHVRKQGGANGLLHFGAKTTPRMSFKLDFHPNGYGVSLDPAVDDSLYFTAEEYWFHGTAHEQPLTISLGTGHLESQLADRAQQKPIAEYVVDSIHSWRVFHFHDTSSAAAVKLTQKINDNQVLRDQAQNLAAFLYRLREGNSRANYKRIVAAVRGVAPFFDEFILEPDPNNPDTIRLEWKEKGSDEYFGANALSDGTLRFICLAALLLQPEHLLPKTILVDEPELGLHPFAIQKLAAMIRSAATKTQVIISTQSVTLLNQFTPEDVVVVDREAGSSTFRRIAPDEVAKWVDDYALGELWEKNVIGGRPQ